MAWIKLMLETLGTIGNYSKEGSEKYKKKVIDINRFAGKFHIENSEEDITKKINKEKK